MEEVLVGSARGLALDDLALLPARADLHRKARDRGVGRQVDLKAPLDRAGLGVVEDEVELGEGERLLNDRAPGQRDQPQARPVARGQAQRGLGCAVVVGVRERAGPQVGGEGLERPRSGRVLALGGRLALGCTRAEQAPEHDGLETGDPPIRAHEATIRWARDRGHRGRGRGECEDSTRASNLLSSMTELHRARAVGDRDRARQFTSSDPAGARASRPGRAAATAPGPRSRRARARPTTSSARARARRGRARSRSPRRAVRR
ncbi:hypothetical protein ENSA5_49680 [Enhygromyxa salina]|uniref:Uncharacterized protein n=1 Tax=Enhygromyxa salina TaxID=215803 RepID=A0A2S9XHM9_9BACT|nr:hypothetical protein ENSA5_49680 [Enhygromyxa salina]